MGKFREFGKILHKKLSFYYLISIKNALHFGLHFWKFRYFAKMTCTIAWFCAMSYANLYKTKTKQNFLNFYNINAHI